MNEELTPLEVSKLLKDFVFELELGNVDKLFVKGSFDIIETALKRLDYLERVSKDLQESKDKLIEERNNKIIEHRIVYDNYNFQSIKKFIACKGCQYYENEKCSNTTGCFWIDAEKQFKALEIIRKKKVNVNCIISGWSLGKYNSYKTHINLTQQEYDLLKEVLE